MRLHRVEPSPPARHDKKSRQLGNRYVVGSQLACQGRGHDMPTQGKPRHAKLPIASLSRNALNGAMPSQGKQARQGMSRPSHAKAKTCQGHAMPRHDMPRPRHDMPTQGKATPCQRKPRQRMPRPCPTQGKAIQRQRKPRQRMPRPCPTQGKPRHAQRKASQSQRKPRQCMPRPCPTQGKASQRQRKPRQRMPRPSQGHAACQGTTCQRNAKQGNANARHAKAKARHGKARQSQGKAKARQAKANARQGKPNAWQGKHVKIQSVGWVASPSFGGKLNGKGGGGTNRSDAG
ncbi:unnamed protein product, partial [Prunus brigantina]